MLRPFLLLFAVPFLYLTLCASSAHASLDDDVRLWMRLRDTANQSDFSTYARFLNTRKNWPENGVIRLNAERALLKAADRSAILQWFATHQPVTDDAELRYVIALADSNRTTEASNRLKEKWRNGGFNEDQQAKIRNYFWKWLSEDDHQTRLDNLIWQNKLDRAEKALTYVNNSHIRQAGQARIALQRGSSKAIGMMNALSATAKQDNGVIFDLARYYRQKGQDAKAIEILGRRRKDIHSYNAQWWRERNLLARRALEAHRYQQAYNLAAAHGHTSGIELAEAEWLAGWVALTRLKKPSAAYNHFDHMYRNVKSPISVSRAAYWAGIAAGQTGQKEQAVQWYRLSARHMNTFYGQMAAYALNQPKEYFAAFFNRNQNVPTTIDSRLPNDLIGAARILNTMQKPRERDMFLRALLRDAQDKNIPHMVIPVARQFNHNGIALAAAKAAYDKDILVSDALFPQTKVPRNPDVDQALTLSIIRQESMFDPLATSTANARGLMQILPGTARHISKRDGLGHTSDAQLYQPQHNMVLGQAYLGHLLERYDGFVPLASAAYNAGPGNVSKWLDTMGDPRKDPYSWVDWVERIPFYETRNYVQRIWENYTAYKYLLNSR